MNDQQRKIIKLELHRAFEAHIKCLNAGSDSLEMIASPNRSVPLLDMLNFEMAKVRTCVESFEIDFNQKLNSCLEKMELTELSQTDVDWLEMTSGVYLNPQLYLDRFDDLIFAVRRKLAGLGVNPDFDESQIQRARASAEVHAKNAMQSIARGVEACVGVKAYAATESQKDIFEFKPNIGGFGVDLKALWAWMRN